MINKELGQSLLELTISLGLMLIVVSILAINTVNGLKSSQFSKNQALATGYSQEGIEAVKSAKNRNCRVDLILPSATSKYWFDTTGDSSIWSGTPSGDSFTGAYVIRYFNINNYDKVPCFITEVDPSSKSITLANNPAFKRVISIENDNSTGIRLPARKKITSTVLWSDLSGDHQSNLVTIITQ
jgi:hypothetical protein